MIRLLQMTIIGLTALGWIRAAHTIAIMLHHPFITVFSFFIGLVILMMSGFMRNGTDKVNDEGQYNRISALAREVWGTKRPAPSVSLVAGRNVHVSPNGIGQDHLIVGIEAAHALNDSQLSYILAHEYYHCDHGFQGALTLSRLIMELLFIMSAVHAVMFLGTSAIVTASLGLLASALADQLNELLMDLQAARRQKVRGAFIANAFAILTKVNRMPVQKRMLNTLVGFIMTPVRSHPPIEIRLLIQRTW